MCKDNANVFVYSAKVQVTYECCSISTHLVIMHMHHKQLRSVSSDMFQSLQTWQREQVA